jgi:hypothetical protein
MDANDTFNGQEANQGDLTIGTLYPNEGYAVLRCGNTSVKIGYTLLHDLQIHIDKNSARFSELADLQKAVYSIACEASLGHQS